MSLGGQPEVWRHSKPSCWTGAVVFLVVFAGMVVASVEDPLPASEDVSLLAVVGLFLAICFWVIFRSRAEIHSDRLVVVNYLERHDIAFADLIGPVHTKREVVFEVAGRRDVTVTAVPYGYWLKDLRGEGTETRGDRFIRAVMEAKAAH